MLHVRETALPDVKIVVPEVFTDKRGYFKEVFSTAKYAQIGITERFVQDNISQSNKNVLRGMHYNLSAAKLVQALRGSIYDVVVDMRETSAAYKKWFGCRLTAQNHWQVYIPAGFAHGFVSLEDDTEVLYKTTGEYSLPHNRGIIWNDPDLAIPWPVETPILSEADRQWPLLRDAERIRAAPLHRREQSGAQSIKPE